MLRLDKASALWSDPVKAACGAGSEEPLSVRLDEYDNDPLDIDILDIWRQDEGVDDDGYSDEDVDSILILDDYDDDELLDE